MRLPVHGRGENLATEHIPSVVDDGDQMLSMPFRTAKGLPAAPVPMTAMENEKNIGLSPRSYIDPFLVTVSHLAESYKTTNCILAHHLKMDT
jgi:hypothetical protein